MIIIIGADIYENTVIYWQKKYRYVILRPD